MLTKRRLLDEHTCSSSTSERQPANRHRLESVSGPGNEVRLEVVAVGARTRAAMFDRSKLQETVLADTTLPARFVILWGSRNSMACMGTSLQRD